MTETPPSPSDDDCTTIEVARRLGLAVRSIQLMVDRGEFEAWKTPGGHRRISRASVERWLAQRQGPVGAGGVRPRAAAPVRPRVLVIEDSAHFQKLIGLLMKQRFPDAELRMADDGISGLAMVGQWQPQVLVVDILLPGIDGAALITGLRSHPQFSGMRLIVVTSLDEAGRVPYAFALQGVPVIHKPRLVLEFPALMARCLDETAAPVDVR